MKFDLEKKIKGVSYDNKERKFRVRITNPTSGSRLFLGRFDSKRDAVVARRTAETLFKLL